MPDTGLMTTASYSEKIANRIPIANASMSAGKSEPPRTRSHLAEAGRFNTMHRSKTWNCSKDSVHEKNEKRLEQR
jgi:hypothetical protein